MSDRIVTVVLTDFTDRSSHDNVSFNRESVERYLQSDEYRNMIERRHFLGLLTHGDRSNLDQSIPDIDSILKSDDFCNFISKTWIEGDEWLAEVHLVDTPAAERLIASMRSGIEWSVSIVVELNADYSNGYILERLYGVDFTLDPAFSSARVVSRNFSRSTRGRVRSIPIKKFSFNSYIRDSKRDPANLLHYRMRDVCNVLKSTDDQDAGEWALDYIREVILRWILKAFKSDGIINITLGLRLNRYVDSGLLTDFNSKLNRAKRMMNSEGTLSVQYQKMIREPYAKLIKSLMSYVSMKTGKMFSSDYLNQAINRLYAYMYEEEIQRDEFDSLLNKVIERRKEDGRSGIVLFDDPDLEEAVFLYWNEEDPHLREEKFEKIREYCNSLVKIETLR